MKTNYGERPGMDRLARERVRDAAPDLLAACEAGRAYCAELRKVMDDAENWSTSRTVVSETLDALFDVWESSSVAAIAQARGTQAKGGRS